MRKIQIRVPSFFQKQKLKNKDKPYGHYYYCAPEGVGKTYSAVEFIYENRKLYKTVWTNRPLQIPDVKIEQYHQLSDVYRNNPNNCLVLIDDVFDLINPSGRTPQEFLQFIYKCRRNHRIVLTTGQSWLDTPIWFRRSVRYVFMLRRVLKNVLIGDVGNARAMKYDKESGEYVCPPYAFTLAKMRDKIMMMYNTLEGG